MTTKTKTPRRACCEMSVAEAKNKVLSVLRAQICFDRKALERCAHKRCAETAWTIDAIQREV